MEAVTAFVEGPLCFVILYGMLKQKSWRFTLQFAVSLGQFYGDVLYFATSWYDGTFVSLDTAILVETQCLGFGIFPHSAAQCTCWTCRRTHVNAIHVFAATVQRRLMQHHLLTLHNIGITVNK